MNNNNNPLAVWSLVLGILSLIFCGPVSGIPAVICGHTARARIKAEPGKWTGEGMALAGLIMGYLSIVLSVILFFLAIFAAILIPSVIKLKQQDQPNPPQTVMHRYYGPCPAQSQFASFLT